MSAHWPSHDRNAYDFFSVGGRNTKFVSRDWSMVSMVPRYESVGFFQGDRYEFKPHDFQSPSNQKPLCSLANPLVLIVYMIQGASDALVE